MSTLGIPGSTIATLVRDVSLAPKAVDDDGIADRFARAVWSCIAEPGDGVAGRLIGALGAEAALEPLARNRGAAGIVDALLDAGDDIPELSKGSDGEAFRALDEAAARWSQRLTEDVATRAFTQASRFAVRLVVPGDDAWPSGLDDLAHHAPAALWVRGDPERLAGLGSSIALVGARAATGYGEHVTVELSAGLVDRGYAIVSGAAYGIDGAAHRAALASSGLTVAVLAGGVDRFYPAGHDALLGQIVARGVVVSEVPCGSAPTKWRFLQRNRLIAAMSQATVVVEAGWRSGSLNTAGHAATLGRPIGAVPGPVTSSASNGCHRLLREFAAVCVTNADEVAELAPRLEGDELLTPADSRHTAPPSSFRPDPDGTRTRMLDAMSERGARPVDRIARESGLAPDRVRAELGLLELEGVVRDRGNGWVRVSS